MSRRTNRNRGKENASRTAGAGTAQTVMRTFFVAIVVFGALPVADAMLEAMATECNPAFPGKTCDMLVVVGDEPGKPMQPSRVTWYKLGQYDGVAGVWQLAQMTVPRGGSGTKNTLPGAYKDGVVTVSGYSHGRTVTRLSFKVADNSTDGLYRCILTDVGSIDFAVNVTFGGFPGEYDDSNPVAVKELGKSQ